MTPFGHYIGNTTSTCVDDDTKPKSAGSNTKKKNSNVPAKRIIRLHMGGTICVDVSFMGQVLS